MSEKLVSELLDCCKPSKTARCHVPKTSQYNATYNLTFNQNASNCQNVEKYTIGLVAGDSSGENSNQNSREKQNLRRNFSANVAETIATEPKSKAILNPTMSSDGISLTDRIGVSGLSFKKSMKFNSLKQYSTKFSNHDQKDDGKENRTSVNLTSIKPSLSKKDSAGTIGTSSSTKTAGSSNKKPSKLARVQNSLKKQQGKVEHATEKMDEDAKTLNMSYVMKSDQIHEFQAEQSLLQIANFCRPDLMGGQTPVVFTSSADPSKQNKENKNNNKDDLPIVRTTSLNLPDLNNNKHKTAETIMNNENHQTKNENVLGHSLKKSIKSPVLQSKSSQKILSRIQKFSMKKAIIRSVSNQFNEVKDFDGSHKKQKVQRNFSLNRLKKTISNQFSGSSSLHKNQNFENRTFENQTKVQRKFSIGTNFSQKSIKNNNGQTNISLFVIIIRLLMLVRIIKVGFV